MSGIEHQLAEVVSQTSLIGLESFLGTIFSSVIDGDADRSGELGSQSDGFDFGKSESSAESGPVAVPNGLASDGGSESIKGSGSDGGGSSSSGLKSSSLASSLVEPDTDVSLPVFPEVDVREDVVMLNH